MEQIQAISVGHALDIDLAGFGAVHSVFGHAVNLTIRGDMWTLLAEDKTDLPFGIRLALSNVHTLGLCSGDLVVVRSGFLGIGSKDVALTPSSFQIQPATDQDNMKLKLAMTKDELKNAAEFKPYQEPSKTSTVGEGSPSTRMAPPSGARVPGMPPAQPR